MPDDAVALAEAPDPAILRAERRLRILEELTEIAMSSGAGPRTPGARRCRYRRSHRADGVGRGRLRPCSVAFARISRAIRLTLALEARADEQLRALRAGVAAECEARRVLWPANARRTRRRREKWTAATPSRPWSSRRPSGRSRTRKPWRRRRSPRRTTGRRPRLLGSGLGAPARDRGAAVRRPRTHPRLEPLGRRGMEAAGAVLQGAILDLVPPQPHAPSTVRRGLAASARVGSNDLQ